MSILSDKTDYRAIKIIARSLKLLQGLDKLTMTKTDDFEISLAENMMKSVIENNGQVIEIKPPNEIVGLLFFTNKASCLLIH